MTRLESIQLYTKIGEAKDCKTMRGLCLTDLFFLLAWVCNRKDMNRDWIYDRIREVEKNRDGYLDLWSREHYKSSVITFGLTLQDILRNPDITVGIFSHTRPIAKSFLSQIKRELESNKLLQGLFPDVIYSNPQKESPRWSLDDGIVVRRKTNPKEATVEAWGIVDGQPVSKHFSLMCFDDVVTRESVSTPEMIAKVTEMWSLSLNLAAQNGAKRYIGTRYHMLDTYATIIERAAAIPRIYPATDDGTLKGKPVLWTKAEFDQKVQEMGSWVAASQLLQNPLADNVMGFRAEWLEFYDILRNGVKNTYVLVDAANDKKRGSDYTVAAVVGLGSDNNYYLLDGIRDRLNLTERTKMLFELVRKWNPKAVGYERYGMMSDVEHIKYVQNQEDFRFRIVELGGSMSKNDRIRRLTPIFENHRFYIPRRLLFSTIEGKLVDFIQSFINEEYSAFPVSVHDDMLDSMSRICDEDLCAVFPKKTEEVSLSFPKKEDRYDPLRLTTFQVA